MGLAKTRAILGLSAGLIVGCTAESQPQNYNFNASQKAHAQTFENADVTELGGSVVSLSDMTKQVVLATNPHMGEATSTSCDITSTFHTIAEPTNLSVDIDGTMLDLQVDPNGYNLQPIASSIGQLLFEGESQELNFVDINNFDTRVYVTPMQNFVEIINDTSVQNEELGTKELPTFSVRYVDATQNDSNAQNFFTVSSGYFPQTQGDALYAYGIQVATGNCQ